MSEHRIEEGSPLPYLQRLAATPLKISEAGTVQFPMVRHAAEIGWTTLTPDEARAKRGGDAGTFLRDVLEAKLAAFNPWLTADAVRAIVETLDALPASIEGNRELLSWLRGERAWYDEAEKRHRAVTLIDFDHTAANVFHVTWEWKIKPPARKGNRADVMFVVNGLPVVIVEHKNPKDGDAIERAIKQLRRYELETPELLATTQLFNVTHLLDYWYGVTWNANRRDMARWKQVPEESYRFAVQAFFEPPSSCAPCSTGFCSTCRTVKRANPCCASTSAAPSTPSSRAVPTRPRRAGWCGTRRVLARPSHC